MMTVIPLLFGILVYNDLILSVTSNTFSRTGKLLIQLIKWLVYLMYDGISLTVGCR